jgi:SAM-dependent methyltransferase
MSTKDLKQKYRDEPVVTEDIVEVDYVLKDNMSASVGGKKFDYIVASHVIEHIDDIVGWLKDIESVLKPGGILSLVIPDKRFTFDITRDESRPSEIIGAYIDGYKRPLASMVYDHLSQYVADVSSERAWLDPRSYQNAGKRWTNQEAYDLALESKKGLFVDTHCYVFTPRSFLEVLKELTKIGLIGFEVEYFLETQLNELEFYVSLKKVSTKKIDKQKALKKIPKLKDEDPWQTIKTLNNRIDRLENTVRDMTDSTSWRITSPLRKAKKLLEKIANKSKKYY